MRLTRYFFISHDLDDLERVEGALEDAGLVRAQIHLLTLDDTGAERHHHLHAVASLMKRDLVHSTLIGAGVGAVAAIVVLLAAGIAGWTDTGAGWMPFLFLAVIVFGFFAWEGGLRGIDTPNARFRHFEKALNAGEHVFFVDLEPAQRPLLDRTIRQYPAIRPAGTGRGSQHWLVRARHGVKRFFVETFP